MQTHHEKSIQDLKRYLNSLNSENTNQEVPKFLFRGQTQDFGNIKPSFARVAHNSVLRGQSYTIYRYSPNLLRGLYGYSISSEEAVAVLQHYGMPTPQIDLTHNIDIAIYFATEIISQDILPRIYVIDTSKVNEDVVLTDHFFLVNDLANAGLNNRWLRQDGYAIMHKDWVSAKDAEEFDLYDSKFSDFISCVTFDPVDLENIVYVKTDVYNNLDDIPRKLKSILNIYCEHQFSVDLHPELRDRINAIDQ